MGRRPALSAWPYRISRAGEQSTPLYAAAPLPPFAGDAGVSGYNWQGNPVYEIIEYPASKSVVGRKQFRYITGIEVKR